MAWSQVSEFSDSGTTVSYYRTKRIGLRAEIGAAKETQKRTASANLAGISYSVHRRFFWLI